ncbi:MBOAT family protein [Parvularcula sp. IMCC14364]|uniref:MBOAT family O-acyltransferase n=1 Tax=Parvularcula sp. IMCC14364 TaxID=3067902 RepID=UPI002741FD01|nr:MBOAT family O-acyltransferase [Parvularcula sp. IMCC14364]
MLFNSGIFFLFFACFFCLYWLMRGQLRLQNGLILGASYLFYGWWDERFLILIALSTACDFICGLGTAGPRYRRAHLAKAAGLLLAVACIATLPTIATSWIYLVAILGLLPVAWLVLRRLDQLSGPIRRKAYLVTSIILNLGLLGIFKYFGFFTESFVQAFSSLGMNVNESLVQIILPVGISFYTFQTLSYTIDIYRKQMQPTERLIDFAAYVAFFPQLVAGPIERARNLLPQFENTRQWDGDKATSGALLFTWGLFKKIVIADNIAPIANAAFASPAEAAPVLMLVGIIAFAFQIYCDFSGYSDMARGLARMIGFDLMLNFNLPYLSRTPSEFWRRWHISLSSWLRDYLYVPLGGNRKGRLLTYRNLFITMLLGGLWHGAAWTFIAWGAFHGAILAVYRVLSVDAWLARQQGPTARSFSINLGAWAVMTVLTLVGWTFFRTQSIGDAFTAMAVAGSAVTSGAIFTELFILPQTGQLLFYLWPLLLVQTMQATTGKLEFMPPLMRASEQGSVSLRQFAGLNALLFLICGIFFLSADGGQQFIYFDF